MDATLGLYLVLIFAALIAVGVPIAIAIGVSSVVILISAMPFQVAVSTAGQRMVNGIDSFSLLAVPLFILVLNCINLLMYWKSVCPSLRACATETGGHHTYCKLPYIFRLPPSTAPRC